MKKSYLYDIIIYQVVIIMNINYDKILKKELEIIKNNNIVPNILLHSCCAPCSSYVIEYLTNYFNITILYYNPNISPYEEYLKRKKEQIKLINTIPTKNKINILDCDYNNNLYKEQIKGLEQEPEKGARCTICFNLRLEYTAKKSKENNYDYFGTTLTVSPYKNSALINSIGKELSKKYNIKWLYSDFKKNNGYKRSIELSKEYNLYRQNYCGCIYSKRD